MHDNLYSKKQNKVDKFAFNKQVVDVFPDMIRRSVPGYDLSLSMIRLLGEQYGKNNTNIYDLGCSRGAVCLELRDLAEKKNCKIIGVDNSKSMIDYCNAASVDKKIEYKKSDILDIKFENASIIILNFTLQFILKDKRSDLLARVYESLVPGGIVIISEKIAFKSILEQKFFTNLHYNFKKSNGYSDLEIKQKRDALEEVLVPEHIEMHMDRLKGAGFDECFCVQQIANFAMILGIKIS